MIKSDRILFVKDDQTETIVFKRKRGAGTERMWLLAILKRRRISEGGGSGRWLSLQKLQIGRGDGGVGCGRWLDI